MANLAAAHLRKRAGGALRPVQRRKTKGRISKYCAEHCEIAIALGKQGKSISEIALVLNVDRDTLYEWERSFPEFRQALARARTFSQAWWEAKAQKSLGKKVFQAQLWRYSMAGRFKHDYADPGHSVNVAIGADLLDAITEATKERAAQLADRANQAKPIEPLDVETKGPER